MHSCRLPCYVNSCTAGLFSLHTCVKNEMLHQLVCVRTQQLALHRASGPGMAALRRLIGP